MNKIYSEWIYWNYDGDFNEYYDKLINKEFPEVSTKDFEIVKNYLNLRCISYHESEIDYSSSLKQINNMLRRIAIDLWEVVKYKFICDIPNILRLEGNAGYLIYEQIMYPLYAEDEGN